MRHALLPFPMLFCCTHVFAALSPTNLTCEYSTDPLGVDVAQPHLSWIDNTDDSQARGMSQTAYEIVAAPSVIDIAKMSNLLWLSGRIKSSSTRRIPYSGKPLRTAQQVFWRVRVWDDQGDVSNWSSAATFTMGVLSKSDWKAKWISYPPSTASTPSTTDSLLLRRELNVGPNLSRALVFVCGLGQYELTVNGTKSGDDLLSPGWTKYDKTCLYDTRDITELVRPGRNALGLILGNGMYNVHGGRYTKFVGSFGPQKAICQILLQYADGTKQTIASDNAWKVSPGPITFSSIYGGEDFDSRLVQAGWDTPGFNVSTWHNAAVVAGPGGQLKGLSCAAPPIVITQIIKPRSITKISLTTSVYDLWQNASFMPRTIVSGPLGSTVTITPAELVNSDGTVDRESVGGGEAYWKYTLSGDGVETFFPSSSAMAVVIVKWTEVHPQGSHFLLSSP